MVFTEFSRSVSNADRSITPQLRKNTVISDRLTGVLLSDILTHPFFLEVDWDDMECGRGDLAIYPPAIKLLKRSAETSDYSPPSAAVGSHSKMRHKLLDLDDVTVCILLFPML